MKLLISLTLFGAMLLQLCQAQNFAWNKWRANVRRAEPIVPLTAVPTVPVADTATQGIELIPITATPNSTSSEQGKSLEVTGSESGPGSEEASVDLVAALNSADKGLAVAASNEKLVKHSNSSEVVLEEAAEPLPKFVMMIIGSGCQNPSEFLTANAGKTYGFEGPNMLSNSGKKSAFDLGMLLRWHYSELPMYYNVNHMKILSSSESASMSTLQTFLAAMMMPQGKAMWNPNLAWQPAIFALDDQLLNLKALKCGAIDSVLDKINDEMTDAAAALLKDNEEVIKFVSERTGWEPTLAKMSDVAANLATMKASNVSFPDWVESNKYNTSVYPHIKQFRRILDLVCAKDKACRQLSAGALLGDIFRSLAEQNARMDMKAKIYSASGREITALLEYLGVDQSAPLENNPTLVIEYFSEPEPAVRGFYYVAPKNEDNPPSAMTSINFKACPDTEMCPLSQFLQSIRQDIILDWANVCQPKKEEVVAVAAVEKTPECKKEHSVTNQGETGATSEVLAGGSTVSILIDCDREKDESGETYCVLWADADYCKSYRSVREFYCRRTCMCNPKYRARALEGRKH